MYTILVYKSRELADAFADSYVWKTHLMALSLLVYIPMFASVHQSTMRYVVECEDYYKFD